MDKSDLNEVATTTVDNTNQQADIAQNATKQISNDDGQSSQQSTDVKPYEIPPDMAKVVNLRLSVLIRLERLEQTRQQMAKSDQLSSRAELEITRQQRELQRLPNADIVTPALENLEKKLADTKRIYELQQSGELDPEQAAEQLAEQVDTDAEQDSPDEQKTQEDKKEKTTEPAVDSLDDFDFDDDDLDEFDLDENDDEDDSQADEDEDALAEAALIAAAAAEPVDETYIELLQLACDQAQLLLKRDSITELMLKVSAQCTSNLPLYQLLSDQQCDPTKMFGWTTYSLALQTVAETTSEKIAAVQQRIDADTKGEGQLTDRDEFKLLANLKVSLAREQKAITKDMVNEFWLVYEQSAVILTTSELSSDSNTQLRAFLRFALLGDCPWLISSAAYDAMMEQMTDNNEQLDDQPAATHVLYPDEYIELAAKGVLTPSIDQDLELNGKGSDSWRADKLWRKIVFGNITESTMLKTVEGLKIQQEKRELKSKKIDEKLLVFQKGRNKKNPKFLELQQKQQANNVMLARVTRAIDNIEGKQLTEIKDTTKEATEKLEKIKEFISPKVIVQREAQGIRRLCKLCAKLKEPYLPLKLRENYKFGGGAVNDRQAVLSEVQEIEKLDPNVFRDVLVPARKKEHRIMIRYSPYVLLVPGQGMMGMSWNPRGTTEVGRLVLPTFNMRPGMLQRMLHSLIADFRFDTSKESAGVDLLTSDTLVAAYANARWNYRKRNKDIREKAGFFNDENDRTNWRRHYQLYITSANDAGKKLFFKCPEVYEAVIKYMGLPPGVERLS